MAQEKQAEVDLQQAYISLLSGLRDTDTGIRDLKSYSVGHTITTKARLQQLTLDVLSSPAAYRAVMLRADGVGDANINVIKVENNEVIDDQSDLCLAIKQIDDLLAIIEFDIMTTGFSFVYVNRLDIKDPYLGRYELRHLDQGRVQGLQTDFGVQMGSANHERFTARYSSPQRIYRQDGSYRLSFEINEGNTLVFKAEHGIPPIAPALPAIDMWRNMTRYNTNMLKNGLHPSTLAFVLKQGNDQTAKKFKEKLNEEFKGAQNAGKPIVALGDVGDVRNLGVTNKDMDYSELSAFVLREVSRALDVPSQLLSDPKDTTFRNSETFRRIFYENTIVRRWNYYNKAINRVFDRLVATNSDYRDLKMPEGVEAYINTSSVKALQLSASEQATRAVQLAGGPIISPNEAREEMGFAEVEDNPDADNVRNLGGIFGFDAKGGINQADPILLRNIEKRRVEHRKICNELSLPERRFINRFAERFRGVASKLEDTVLGVLMGLRKDSISTDKLLTPEILEEFSSELRDSIDPEIEGFYNREMQAEANRYNLFTPSAPSQDRFFQITERQRFWRARLNDGLLNRFATVINESVAGDLTIDQISGRVKDVFQDISDNSAVRIARTETTAAANASHIDAYAQNSIPNKVWLATVGDRRTRQSHLDVNDQSVPVDGTFDIEGYRFTAPGLPVALNTPPELFVNCRCSTTPGF